MAGKGVEIVHLEGEMRQIRTDLHRAALIELADLDHLLAARRFEENQFRTARRSVPLHFLETEHILVK